MVCAIGKAVMKLEAPIQSTGEAQYPSDVPLPTQGYHAAFVYSTQSAVVLHSIDADAVLATHGVINVYTAADIPGVNSSYSASQYLFVPIGSEVLCNGAPVALVVATSEAVANSAAAAVMVSYLDIGKNPIYDIDTAVACSSFYDVPPTVSSHMYSGVCVMSI